jgi:hypothetical protein
MKWKTVTFTEFVRPFGRRRPFVVDLGPDVLDKVDKIVEAGLELTVENLGNGYVCWAIAGKNTDAANIIIRNGTSEPKPIIDMIMDLDIEKALAHDAEAGG